MKVVWLTGLPGSGKTSIACATQARLHQLGYRTVMLDGDKLREGLNADLGFSIADRNESVRRTGEVAKLFLQNGTLVLVALVSPMREARDKVRRSLPAADFLEVHCSCPIAICQARDPKGHYAKAASGKIAQFTGVSSPYEAPIHADLRLETGSASMEASVNRLMQFLSARLAALQAEK